jgi:hypothetical protein
VVEFSANSVSLNWLTVALSLRLNLSPWAFVDLNCTDGGIYC